ncbi:nitroreductase family deazaflavin-dependent oxidoreductase [Virgisporangium ochraceum]
MTDDVVDSPNAFVADHIRRFEATCGHPRPGVNDLLLTTRGRRTGTLRRTALMYARDGDRYVVVASNAGADRHPAWYLNLVADPRVTVRVGDRTFAATARTGGPEERQRLWDLMVATMPSYDGYREATSREIPVVVLYSGR